MVTLPGDAKKGVVVSALTKENVVEAKALISEEITWARFSTGGWSEAGQRTYCAGGALAQVITGDTQDMYSSDSYPEGDYLAEFVDRAEIDGPILHWNDFAVTEHSEVLAAFDRVIASFGE